MTREVRNGIPVMCVVVTHSWPEGVPFHFAFLYVVGVGLSLLFSRERYFAPLYHVLDRLARLSYACWGKKARQPGQITSAVGQFRPAFFGQIGAAITLLLTFLLDKHKQDDLRDLELLCASLELELEKRENDVKMDNHSGISIYGDATNVQIQQDTANSTQTQHIESTTVDFDKAGEIIDRIRTYQSMFDSEFGDRSQELSETLNEASDAIEKKEHGRLKSAWSSIKAIMENAGGSLIAAGILEALNSLPALLQGV